MLGWAHRERRARARLAAANARLEQARRREALSWEALSLAENIARERLLIHASGTRAACAQMRAATATTAAERLAQQATAYLAVQDADRSARLVSGWTDRLTEIDRQLQRGAAS